MTPRQPTSLAKNRTKLPPDSVNLIRETFQEDFATFLEGKEAIVDGEIYLGEILMQVGFREKGAIRQHNFECSLNFDRQKQNPMDLIYLAVDAISTMWEQYIAADGDIEFPPAWTEFEIDNTALWLKTSSENSELEAQANALLGDEFIKELETIDEQTVDDLFAQLRADRDATDDSDSDSGDSNIH